MLNAPGGTWATGIDGSNIVGYYIDASGKNHGFLYSGSTYATVDMTGALIAQAYGISGTNIVGCYYDANGKPHGFIATTTMSKLLPPKLLK